MTLVIGAINKNYVILASDGYALYQADHSMPVYKLDTYSKIKLFHNPKVAFGFAGSHAVSMEFFDGFLSDLNKDEIVFLESLKHDLAVINGKDESKKAACVIGYHFHESPRIVLFPQNGGYEIQSRVCAIGAGADVAINYLSNHRMDDCSLCEAITTLIESIYNSSIIPTVNFLPMIIVLGTEMAIDLSNETINAFEQFKADLKVKIIAQAQISFNQRPT